MKKLSLLLIGAVGCGSSADVTKDTPGGGAASKPTAAGDVAIELPGIEVKGMVFEPEALGRPGMPLVEAKKKITIEKQRTVFSSTKDPVQKEAQAAILATMLYQKAKDDKANEKALLSEARQVLRDAAQGSGDNVDEITLRLLGSYELMLEDFAAAEKAWGGLVAKTPKDKAAAYNRAWWTFSLLKQFKNAEALAVVKETPVSDKDPELAYVTAWAKWRAHDDAGAWAALAMASKGWKDNAGRDVVDRDLFLFAGRSRAPLAEVKPQLFGVLGAKQKPQQYEVLKKLGLQSYGFAGRWDDGIAALDQAIELAGDAVPAEDRPLIRFSQADFAVRLGAPDVSVKYATQAIQSLPKCGAKCSDKDKQDFVLGVLNMGTLFHVLYATANDIKYYQPAHDLYALTIGLVMDNEKRADAQKNSAALETTLRNTKAGTGTHDKGAVGTLLARHNQEVQACYEATLTLNPKVSGALSVDVEVDQSGAVTGVSTEPKAGLADMAAVAGCAAEHAKTWKLPKRGMPGTTRIKVGYALSPRS
ncbi:MAG: AgmX/PglI C-terminal domain-containing protein [Kofleriaceae bacterium]